VISESVQFFDTLPDGSYVSAKTVANVLDVSRATVWRLAKAGKLTAKKIGERNTRFSVREIRAILANA
jgi:excisionase family DNA binding protein